MENISSILKIILPAIITSIFTFFITKYTYNQNRPLDKMEIAYNRIYYPLYRLIRQNNNNDVDAIIEKAKYYFKKYDKYIDRSTLKIFNFLKECDTKAKKKSVYKIFCNNIFDKNAYLRRRLGYLEPSFSQMYTYSPPSEKATLKIFADVCIIYACLIIGSVAKGKVQIICVAISILVILKFVYNMVRKFISYLYYKVKK